jgi:DNA repair photolyase
VRRRRRSAVLTPSRIPCLGKICTINITQGCAIGCGYCYIQGYSDYPGSGKVILYENTAELLASELQRRRRKPDRVYFSPSSDAFQDVPEVQAITYRTMSLLLDAGVEVSYLTKGFVTELFLELFSETPAAVFAQVGITTLDPALSTTIEPGAAPPDQRLEAMRRLSDIGVQTTARLDPLIPDVTDARSNIEPLLASLRRVGVRFAAASYLFIRPRLARAIHKLLSHVPGARVNAKHWPRQEFSGGCGGGQMLDSRERAHRFADLKAWGEQAGVCVTPCHCKNPEFGGQGCAIAGRPPHEAWEANGQHVFEFGATGTDNPTLS